jgi:predicted  nucleic acid-binding Zn ribbon protein
MDHGSEPEITRVCATLINVLGETHQLTGVEIPLYWSHLVERRFRRVCIDKELLFAIMHTLRVRYLIGTVDTVFPESISAE